MNVNVIYPTKDNFTQPLSVKEVLEELEVFKNDCYRVFSKSKDEDLELHLKRELNSCFANNYFDVGLKAWLARMDIQSAFNENKAVTYTCQYESSWHHSVNVKCGILDDFCYAELLAYYTLENR